MLAGAFIAIAVGAFHQPSGSAQVGAFVDDELLVKFVPGTPAHTVAAVHGQAGGRVIDEIPALGVQVVKVAPGQALQSLPLYQHNPNVKYAELNGIARALDDPFFPTQWGLHNTGQVGGTADADIDAPEAWGISSGSAVRIAVLDTGIKKSHEDITSSRVVAEQNFSSSATVDDVFGHGTHVAGIAAAATDNSIGMSGVAGGAILMNGKVLGDDGGGTYGSVANGIIWAADNGAKVINLSLGGTTSSTTLQDAVTYAWNKGVVLACAAGNNGNTQKFYPAAYSNCIAVAATDNRDQKASFSNYDSSWVDAAAPGVNIASSVPARTEVDTDNLGLVFITSAGGLEREARPLRYAEGTANSGIEASAVYAGLGDVSDFDSVNCTGKIALVQRGSNTFAAKVGNAKADGCVGVVIYNNDIGNFTGTLGGAGDWLPALSISKADGEDLVSRINAGLTTLKIVVKNNYAEWNGTSMATPHVAGAAALVWATCYGTSASSVRNRIESTADAISGTGSLWAHGRVNAFKAVKDCGSSPSPTATPNPTATPVATATPAPTGTPVPTPTATPALGNPNDMYVWNIYFTSVARNGNHKERITVVVQRDSDANGLTDSTDAVVAGAGVSLQVRNGGGTLIASYNGTTDTNGIFRSGWITPGAGTYIAEVTSLTHATYSWNKSLDPTSLDTDLDGDNLPDQSHTIPH
ncbi:MAG: S8 family serine peptidase [Chloroflexi bacterium]|nr:S8 family serine peptidase [Chloroflexota bacterium]